mmetsp:Transcript_75951/g.210893  ORF Transcript_75951/g.210893 Transcript_75951/m.210893 type:complete len:208 (+) Transcript_75951:594-1217(+)
MFFVGTNHRARIHERRGEDQWNTSSIPPERVRAHLPRAFLTIEVVLVHLFWFHRFRRRDVVKDANALIAGDDEHCLLPHLLVRTKSVVHIRDHILSEIDAVGRVHVSRRRAIDACEELRLHPGERWQFSSPRVPREVAEVVHPRHVAHVMHTPVKKHCKWKISCVYGPLDIVLQKPLENTLVGELGHAGHCLMPIHLVVVIRLALIA